MANKFNRINNRKSNPFGFIIFILMITGVIPGILGVIFDIAGGAIEVLGVLLALLLFLGVPIALIVGFIALIVKLINGATSGTKKTSQSSASISSKEVLNYLANWFSTNERLYIDDDTYIVCTNENANELTSYDIYMNEEYISNLLVFANAYPSGFNRLANEIKKAVSPAKTKKKNETVKKQQTAEVKKQNSTAEPELKQPTKDCAYYIKEFQQLNDNIPNEQITNDLNNTVAYLKDIKKIEDEFPECREKTTKLYQYYLPMLVDILENYHRLAQNASNHEEFKSNEDRLSKTIVLINSALKTISGSLVEEYYTDLKVDMKTLESILKKDGLVDEISEVLKD